MPLSDTFVKQTKFSGKPAGDKHSDGGGLYLHVMAAGKYWRLAYRFSGKQKTLALGVYPAVSLAQARRRRDEARQHLAEGTDPAIVKQAQKLAQAMADESTFEAVAREYHGVKKGGWSDKYAVKWLRGLEKDIFPFVGRLQLPDITPPMMLNALRRVEKRGNRDAAHTLAQNSGQVFRYGVQTGRCERNPMPDLQGALEPVVVKHMAAVLEPVKVGELLRAFDSYNGQPITKAALQLSALLFQRPANIRMMEWSWVDLDNAMLTIPSSAMKRTVAQKLNGRPHFVPLAPQAVAILREIRPLTGHRAHVFPSTRGEGRPMSDMTLTAALRRLGYSSEEMTPHGFRAMARTLMIERLPGIHADVIEAQLAHGKSGPLGAAYDRAEFMEQRRKMMNEWADYLDKLKTGSELVRMQA
ncbi:tyrosine-type recombinase/integrase [Comamonas odontotermitis]|uniref:tyrosine-type recombinase/integrase n=1 Tax=Comamonas odontotermitis TaxID=379895 RepID=UPI001CC77AF1|nr:integrase arm-type DNA-binding domain-containing protein [Comamonas odontotermitis]UBB17500.1 integrase arm-type DNA-binding domain-containing protein [Comamonas odontotermitis]